MKNLSIFTTFYLWLKTSISSFNYIILNILPFLFSVVLAIIKKRYLLFLNDLKTFNFSTSWIIYFCINHFIINLWIFMLFWTILFSFLTLILMLLNIIPDLLYTSFNWILSLPYFYLILGYTGIRLIFLAQCFIIYPIICFFWDKGYSEIIWIKSVQLILRVLLLIFLYLFLLGLILLISVNVSAIFFNFDYVQYISYKVSDIFFYFDDLFNSYFYLNNSDVSNSLMQFRAANTLENAIKFNDIFYIHAPTENGALSSSISSSSAEASTSLPSTSTAQVQTEIKSENVGLVKVSKDEHNYNFSVNKDLVNSVANKAIGVIKDAVPHAGPIFAGSVGASAAVDIVKNSGMPLPAKIATIAITAGLTSLATTVAGSAASNMADNVSQVVELAEEQAANSVFNKPLPDGRAPSPEGVGSTMFSPADESWSFGFSFSSEYSPFEVLLVCLLIFQLINFVLAIYLGYLSLMQVITNKYSDRVLLFFENRLSIIPVWTQNMFKKLATNFFNLHKNFFKYILIFAIVLFFFCLICSLIINADLIANFDNYVKVYLRYRK